MKKINLLFAVALCLITSSLYSQKELPHGGSIQLIADIWDNAVPEQFFKIPELQSKNGELKVHLFVNEDIYKIGGDSVRLRSYSYECEGKASENKGPFGPTLRVKQSDRLTMIVHNNLEIGPDRDYLGSLDVSNTKLLKPGRVSDELCTALVLSTDGRISCGNLDGAWTNIDEEGKEWTIHGKVACQCPPGLEGTCEKIDIVYRVKKMYNMGQQKDALRVYQEHDHANSNHNVPHGFNTTNMHTHGFHVSPFQDDIFRTVDPTFTSYYTYDLVDHTPGTMWYHPHVHGSTSVQVASGMSGVIIIEEDDLEKYPALEEASKPEHERVLMFNQIIYDEDIRELPDFKTLRRSGNPKGTTVNGMVVPEMNMQPGEVQRWRMVHSGYSSLLGLHFPAEIEVYQISIDGILFDKPRRIYSVHMAPGNRTDILIKAPQKIAKKEFNIYSIPYNIDCEYFPEDAACINIDTANAEPIMRIKVNGKPLMMRFPKTLPGPGEGHKDIAGSEIINANDPRKAEFQLVLSPDGNQFLVNGKTFKADTIHQRLPLGKAETWNLTSVDFPHPYHIHVNPFQVTEIYDPENANKYRKVDPPVWKDTALVLKGYGARIRTRYQKYWGDFVLHCHILHHEDQGMMQRIKIERPME